MPMTREKARKIFQLGEEAVVDLLVRLSAAIEHLQIRNNQLENQLAKDSHNSHKPPSSDGFKKVKRTKSLRKKSDRRPGGQEGHQGHHLRKVAEPDHIEYHHTPKNCSCGRSLENKQPERFEKRQVFDLPKIQIEITEHRAEVKTCDCGVTHTAIFPQSVDYPVQYGPRIKSVTVYLMNYQHLPYNRTCEAIEDLFNHKLSPGSLYNFNATCYNNLEKTEEIIKEQIISSPVIHNDESGMYVNKDRLWLHSTGTEYFTYYACHPKRGREAMDDIGILPVFKGTSVHDFWNPYLSYDNCLHGLCGAHHLRDLNYIHECYSQSWAKEMRKLFCKIKEKVESVNEYCNQLDDKTVSKFQKQYQKIINDGYGANPPPKREKQKRGRPKRGEPLNLLDRFQNYPEKVLAFMHDFNVPFDNNLAERDIRMMKLKQKISGTFRNIQGARFFCRIRGYLSTVKKQKLKALQAIMSVFENRPNPCFIRAE
jgi:transposase